MGTKPGRGWSEVVSKRCPKCKKIRAFRFSANQWPEERKMWERLEKDGPLVCHVCVARASGESIPKVHGYPNNKDYEAARKLLKPGPL